MSAPSSAEDVDVAIVGAGPAGSCLATLLARAGRRVAVVERADFPRYHIGESLTGASTPILEELGVAEEMDRRQFPPKRGVKVIGHEAHNEFFVPVLNPTWQVRREEFDQILLERALHEGATLRRSVVESVLREGERVVGLLHRPVHGHADGPAHELRARFVADCSGQSSLLARLGVASKRVVDDVFSRQIALFTQYEGARRDPGEMGNNTFIFYGTELHWAWFIPLSPTLTSVGVVMPAAKVAEHGGPEAAFEWGRTHINPDLAKRFNFAREVSPVRALANYSYHVDRFWGEGWCCVGDAHQFIDPIFSFGVSFALIEARAASAAILDVLVGADEATRLGEYAALCSRGQGVARDLIRYFWRFPTFFAFLARGEYRRDVIRLLGSACHDPEELGAIKAMRAALREAGVETAVAGG
ncbi:NAD(P)/FAD-dependent oxidoreductase [Paraliomyxa miuraensis]|uniref:NAD(P)/FAD-dependent oxidoreductase n=1 Tax=Paraliomyxa miuraensis TaxID=376150 RepID=UPI0022530A7B|nr:tryptophan 7-halogenase [Paraliomyxa miuraensis]MCX4241013.1 tryptophan 7-halogenase [Paraliomyxa miuraensis]